MDRETIRLECLRLRYRGDHTMEAIIKDAKTLEDYVSPLVDRDKLSPSREQRPKASKKSDNPSDLFS